MEPYNPNKPFISMKLDGSLLDRMVEAGIPLTRALQYFRDNPEGSAFETLKTAAEDIVPFYGNYRHGGDWKDYAKEAVLLGSPMKVRNMHNVHKNIQPRDVTTSTTQTTIPMFNGNIPAILAERSKYKPNASTEIVWDHDLGQSYFHEPGDKYIYEPKYDNYGNIYGFDEQYYDPKVHNKVTQTDIKMAEDALNLVPSKTSETYKTGMASHMDDMIPSDPSIPGYDYWVGGKHLDDIIRNRKYEKLINAIEDKKRDLEFGRDKYGNPFNDVQIRDKKNSLNELMNIKEAFEIELGLGNHPAAQYLNNPSGLNEVLKNSVQGPFLQDLFTNPVEWRNSPQYSKYPKNSSTPF